MREKIIIGLAAFAGALLAWNMNTIFTALPEQLGIKLDPQRGSVDVLAIKSAELPSEN